MFHLRDFLLPSIKAIIIWKKEKSITNVLVVTRKLTPIRGSGNVFFLMSTWYVWETSQYVSFTSQIVCIYENMIWIEFIMHCMKLWVDNDYSIWYTTTEIHVLNFKYSSCCCLYVVFAFRLIRVWIRVLTYSMSLDDRNHLTKQRMLSTICVSNRPQVHFVDPYKLCDLILLKVAPW